MSSLPQPGEILRGPAAWRGDNLVESREWIQNLSTEELGELDQALAAATASNKSGGSSLGRVGREDFHLAGLAQRIADLSGEILRGRGFVLIRGLDPERYSLQEIATIFWGVGAHIGAAMPQNAKGHLLGHVTDLGFKQSDPATRTYQTNARQGFHTDSADVVGLLCLRPARSGGRSALVSCATLHNEMLERCPELLRELFEPFHTDHRGEYRPGDSPYFTAPVLNWFADEFSVIYQRDYIESAQRFEGVPRLSEVQVAALDAFDRLADDPSLHLEMDLQPGDMQFIHNHQMLHDRTAYRDWAEPERRRHLLRLWLSPPTGRPLPACFAERFGSLEFGRRGGITLTGVAPIVSWTP